MPAITSWHPSTAERNARIVERFKAGETMPALAAAYGITRARVQQIIAGRNLARDAGGAVVAAQRRRVAAAERRDRRYVAKWGHDYAAHKSLLAMNRHTTASRAPIGAFAQQRNNARRRGIAWRLSLAEWWAVWQASGRWPERGRGIGKYVMSRKGDVGPYAPGNVFIQESTDNNSERPQKQSGLPKGTAVCRGGFIAKLRGACLGYYKNSHEAARAYQDARELLDIGGADVSRRLT